MSGPPKWSVYVCCPHLDRCHSNDGECPPFDRMTSMSSMFSVDMYGRVRGCVGACVRACVRACACTHARVRACPCEGLCFVFWFCVFYLFIIISLYFDDNYITTVYNSIIISWYVNVYTITNKQKLCSVWTSILKFHWPNNFHILRRGYRSLIMDDLNCYFTL